MNEQSGRGSPNRKKPRPSHNQADERSGAGGPSGGRRKDDANTPVLLKDVQALERLRDRIETAANEILRLREENAALAERISRLESRPEVFEDDGTLLQLPEDPEALRRKIAGFIEAIDQYLEREQSPGQ